MKLRTWPVRLVLGCIAAGALIYGLTHGKLSEEEPKPSVPSASLSIWVYSKGWEDAVRAFGQSYPHIDVQIRSFRSYEQLYTELLASISAGAAPQLAEVHSFYGIAQLAATGAVLPAGSVLSAEKPPTIPAFSAAFRYRDEDWAVPFGGSVPVLYYREEPFKRLAGHAPALGTWEEVRHTLSLAKEPPGEEVSKGYGTITVDKELPWFLASLSYAPKESGSPAAERTRSALELWRTLTHESGLMKPLQHDKAASDFINGKAGMYVGSSDKLPTIERYIGGKFSFDLAKLPAWKQTALLPGVHGLALLNSDPERLKAAQRFVQELTAPEAQSVLWNTAGLLPVRRDVLEKLEEEPALSERLRRMLNWLPSLAGRAPRYDDYERWKRTERMLEQIELNPQEPVEDIGMLY
ncbi:extracellular solute-binding protein [Paenibacillus ehimensis]|uniref:extracellular solute-binding protein n=1 Tax=Paenibacillus ehimensis TaxID=79264 RepID=UPI0013E3BAD2|nr:extracellular solute-binding protein [Paenibacillus ehimensis]MEC0211309.1 extracellular solute-binding protein [Paenibacillus ehimensis]